MNPEPEPDRHVIPRRIVSIPDDLWNEFGQQIGDKKRSAAIRDFIAWYLRRPRAALPKRPPAD